MRRIFFPTCTINSSRGPQVLRISSRASSPRQPIFTSLRSLAMTSPTEKKVEELIAKNSVQVFSKSYCPYCQKVKGLFDKLSVTYNVTELDEIPDGDDIQEYLAKKTGQRTVPNVFVNKKHIGGCDATYALHNQNKLSPLLKEAGLNPKA